MRMAVSINFHLFVPSPSIACSLFTISVKNQARLKGKIVRSYARVFTVYYISLRIRSNWHTVLAQHDVTIDNTMLSGVVKLSNLLCSTICYNVCWTMLRGYVKLTYICWTTNQIYIAIICSQFFIQKDSSVGSTLTSQTRGYRLESPAPHLTEFFILSVYDDILLACDFYISFHCLSVFFLTEVD